MIISHKHKFIFMHTPKCAGSSIEVSLASVGDEGDLIGPVTSEGLPDDYKHPNTFEEHQEETGGIYNGMRAEEIKNYIGDDIWNEYFKFSVVRNPWDRAISFWHWRDREKTNDWLQYLNEDVKHPKSFLWTFTHMPVLSITKQLQINKKFDIDYLIPYENLSVGYKEVCDRLNIKPIDLPRAKSGYRDPKIPYHRFYTTTTKNIIDEIYKDDIDNFEYKFGE